MNTRGKASGASRNTGRRARGIYCTDEQWAEAARKAEAAAMSTSAWLVDRALNGDPDPAGEPGAELRLTPDEEREMLESVREVASILRGLAEPHPNSRLTLREEVAFIFDKLAQDLTLEEKRDIVEGVLRDVESGKTRS